MERIKKVVRDKLIERLFPPPSPERRIRNPETLDLPVPSLDPIGNTFDSHKKNRWIVSGTFAQEFALGGAEITFDLGKRARLENQLLPSRLEILIGRHPPWGRNHFEIYLPDHKIKRRPFPADVG